VLSAPVSLTSITDPDAVWSLYVEDALTALPTITARAPRSLVDVGTGGGSPGIPLAIETGIRTVLLESRDRKADFLRSAVATLGLTCEVVAQRSEEFGRGDGREAYDMAVTRALAPPPVAVELCLPLVRTGGSVVLWAGVTEQAPVAAAAAQVGGRVADMFSTSPSRNLVVVDKVSATPARFPRRPGMAGKRPLV
jgi:16S rRNA (guanine527-N7)-methyltransferase